MSTRLKCLAEYPQSFIWIKKDKIYIPLYTPALFYKGGVKGKLKLGDEWGIYTVHYKTVCYRDGICDHCACIKFPMMLFLSY